MREQAVEAVHAHLHPWLFAAGTLVGAAVTVAVNRLLAPARDFAAEVEMHLNVDDIDEIIADGLAGWISDNSGEAEHGGIFN
jgi:hypothetical protein